MQVKTIKDADRPKREFAFSQEFPNEVELAFKAYDRVFKELTSISNGKITFPEEYGVVNNLYKFRYITPGDISTFVSNLIKVLKNNMICSHVDDMEKFAVSSVKQFMVDHECVPIEHSSIYGLYNYTTDNMTLKDLLVLCENDFYHRTVVSKFEMEQRVKVMKKDYQKIADMHFTTSTMKIVENLPKLITQTEFNDLSYAEQKAIQTYIEEFILFAAMLNTVIMSNMIFFCVPKSTYDTKLMVKKPKYETNDLLDGDLDEDSDDESVVTESAKYETYTECCLLKTGHIRHIAKIPFDINMRNIVLQDMHPHFKDTKAAIEYITHDTRSPISQMLYRYGHPSEVLNGMDGYMICKMFVNDPCARCQSFDEYANKLHGVDFHTDVCWLDRIAFGNNFLDGNYRAEDSVGNEHKHPIKQTLETLYHMFGETQLKTKEELSNHIIKIAHVMNSIIDMWGNSGIYNWELVRDILVVLGEIMTRSIIKLYDSHMTLIVSDNMDDVDAPGYMYTESASTSASNPSVKPNTGSKSKIKQTLTKIYHFIKQLLHRFTAWIQNVLSKMGVSFARNHQMEVNYVNKHKVLNHEIETALKNGTFKPQVKNWPNYNVQFNPKTGRRLTEVVEGWLRHEDSQHAGVPTVMDIKREFYPKLLVKKLMESKSSTKTESYIFPEAELETMLQEWAFDDEDAIYNESIMYQEAVTPGEEKGHSKPVYVCFTVHQNAHTHVKDLVTKDENDPRDMKKKWNDIVWDKFSELEHSGVVHAAIALEPSLKKAYTYRIYGEKSGLSIQDFSKFYDKPDEGIVVFGAYLDVDSWKVLKNYIEKHVANSDKTRYNYRELFARFIKRSNTLKEGDYKWVCSTFVNAVLEAAGVHVDDIANMPSPSTLKNKMLKRDDFTCVYTGPAREYSAEKVESRISNFAAREHTKNANESNGLIVGPSPTYESNVSENVKILHNYFLYGALEPREPSNQLTVAAWQTLLRNITETGNTFENELKAITEDNKVAANKMQSVVNNLENKIDSLLEMSYEKDVSEDYNRLRKQLDRNRILLQAVNEISREYTAVYASVIRTEFFKVQYKLYRDTVSAYKAQV